MEAWLTEQFELSFLDFAAYVGLAAIAMMTFNVLTGIALSVRYDTVKSWPHRRLSLFRIHEWTGYGALVLVLIHPMWLMAARVGDFGILEVLWPLGISHQPVEAALGALGAYLLVLVALMAYLRRRFPYAQWKKLHYLSYAVLLSALAHGILIDPNLKPEDPIDYLDGGKVFIALCALICTVAFGWRIAVGRRLRRSVERNVAPTLA